MFLSLLVRIGTDFFVVAPFDLNGSSKHLLNSNLWQLVTGFKSVE